MEISCRLMVWETCKLGTIYQAFLDVNNIIDRSNHSEESKVEEKSEALEARKSAFVARLCDVPHWNLR
jgi:hypothetical protein